MHRHQNPLEPIHQSHLLVSTNDRRAIVHQRRPEHHDGPLVLHRDPTAHALETTGQLSHVGDATLHPGHRRLCLRRGIRQSLVPAELRQRRGSPLGLPLHHDLDSRRTKRRHHSGKPAVLEASLQETLGQQVRTRL